MFNPFELSMTLVMADVIFGILLLGPECEYVFVFLFCYYILGGGFNRYFPSYHLISYIVSTVGHIFFSE